MSYLYTVNLNTPLKGGLYVLIVYGLSAKAALSLLQHAAPECLK